MSVTSITSLKTSLPNGTVPDADRRVSLDSVNYAVPQVRGNNRSAVQTSNRDSGSLSASQSAGREGVSSDLSNGIQPGKNVSGKQAGSRSWRSSGPSTGARSTSREFKASDRNNPPVVTMASRNGSAGSSSEVVVGASANAGNRSNTNGTDTNRTDTKKTDTNASEAAKADAQKMLVNIYSNLKVHLGADFAAPTTHAGWCTAIAKVAGVLKGSAKTRFLAKIKTDAQTFGLNFGQSSIALSKAEFAKLDAAHQAINSNLSSEWKSKAPAEAQTSASSAKQPAVGQELFTAEKALEVAKKLDTNSDNAISAKEAEAIPALSKVWSQLAPEGSISVESFAQKLFKSTNQNAGGVDSSAETNTQSSNSVATGSVQTMQAVLTLVQAQSEEQTLAMVTGWDSNKDAQISKAELAAVCPEAAAAWDGFAKGKTEITLGNCVQLLRAATYNPTADTATPATIPTTPNNEPKVLTPTAPNSDIG